MRKNKFPVGSMVVANQNIECPHGVQIPEKAKGKVIQVLDDKTVRVKFHGHEFSHTCNQDALKREVIDKKDD